MFAIPGRVKNIEQYPSNKSNQKMNRAICKRKLIATLLALVSTAAVRGQTENEVLPALDSSPTRQSIQALPRVDHSALLEQLDLTQRQLDAVRKKLKETPVGSDAYIQLDTVQQLLDHSRSQLLEGGGVTPQSERVSREYLLKILQNAEDGLDATIKRMADQPGSESSIAALQASRKNLDNTRMWLQESGDKPLLQVLDPTGVQEMYDKARQLLDESRIKIMSAPEVSALALQQLEADEQKLEEYRRQATALGLLD